MNYLAPRNKVHLAVERSEEEKLEEPIMSTGFLRALRLDGWAHHSAWGHDSIIDSYIALLWREKNQTDTPTAWFIGGESRYPSPELLFGALVILTEAAALDIFRAMSAGDLAPQRIQTGPSLDEICRLQHEAKEYGHTDPYPCGVAAALAWALSATPAGPVTGQPTPRLPTQDQIEAERWAATAARAQQQSRPTEWYAGVEGALMWVRGQTHRPF
ncbi:hypothetical protein AB0L59_26710 [Streptomyces sp. NPDC052109]|uniref:hypothetical protein n=1 Tax=Streptomyces sp. NPDC052109 TaxID=3155527 RepID=UPI0034434784